jgi:hypothetical protein
MRQLPRAAIALSIAAHLSACGASDAPATGPNTGPGSPPPKPSVVRGRVVDARGNPIAGAEVWADNTLYYDTNVIGVTDAQGRYELDVSEPGGTWHMGAQVRIRYDGHTYALALHPDDDSPFAGTTGAVRDFDWRLTGPTPQGLRYGGQLYYYDGGFGDFDPRYVELTFTPAGPLVEGSAGKAFTARSDDAMTIGDIAIGRYTIGARYVPPGESARALAIRVRSTGSYAATVTTSWPSTEEGMLRTLELELLLR